MINASTDVSVTSPEIALMISLTITDPDELERLREWERQVNENLPKYSERQAAADRVRIARIDKSRKSMC